MLRETTVGSGDFEGVEKNPDGTYRRGKYHGADGAPKGASYLYFLGDKSKAQAVEHYFAQHPGAVDVWLGGHTHTFPDDVLNGRSHIERKWRRYGANAPTAVAPSTVAPRTVIPANAGTQAAWVPAFAGMTVLGATVLGAFAP